MAIGITTAGAGVVAAAPPSAPVVVASGLNNPRQLTFGPGGDLYVAEAGKGKLDATDPGGCYQGPEGTPACAGNTSSITKIKNPSGSASSSRIVNGLLSFAGPDGSAATGVDAVSVTSGREVWGIVTFGPPDSLPKSVAGQNGQLIKIDRKGVHPQFDVASYSLAHTFPGHDPESNPYGLLRVGNTSYVADAAANAVYRIDGCKRIKVAATFESRPRDPFDGVPTSIAKLGSRFYVGQLSSLQPGAAKVTVFDSRFGVPWKKIKVYDGLTSVTSVAVAGNGDIYATELFAGAPFQSAGALVKIPHNGGPRVTTELPAPGGVAVDRSGHVYVSINSVLAGAGEVIRLPA